MHIGIPMSDFLIVCGLFTLTIFNLKNQLITVSLLVGNNRVSEYKAGGPVANISFLNRFAIVCK